jgi:hypothetical protein
MTMMLMTMMLMTIRTTCIAKSEYDDDHECDDTATIAGVAATSTTTANHTFIC